jgi:hypothetical protein
MHSADRLMPVLAGFHPLVQCSHFIVELLPELLHRHTVHALCRILAESAVGANQRRLVNVMSQCQKSCIRIPFRSFRYPQESR